MHSASRNRSSYKLNWAAASAVRRGSYLAGRRLIARGVGGDLRLCGDRWPRRWVVEGFAPKPLLLPVSRVRNMTEAAEPALPLPARTVLLLAKIGFSTLSRAAKRLHRNNLNADWPAWGTRSCGRLGRINAGHAQRWERVRGETA
jgi:hypothetical protein